MNRSLTVVVDNLDPIAIVNTINSMEGINIEGAIINGPVWEDKVYNQTRALVTIINCDSKTFSKIKNRAAIKKHIKDKNLW